MRTLSYYYSEKTSEPEGLKEAVVNLAEKYGFGFLAIRVDDTKELQTRFPGLLPVILVGPYQLTYPFTQTEVEVAILSTLDKDRNLSTEIDSSIEKIPMFSGFEKFSLWFATQYPWVITFFLLIYCIFPFLAPILQQNGKSHAANVIYKTYSILCHQLAFRSYFINGQQTFYPRELAKIKGYRSYEEVTGFSGDDIEVARNFIGNSELGFKVAMCERDLAIYFSMAIVGIVFTFRKKKLKRLPWFLWFILAIIPIGIDGVSQLPGLSSNWPVWMPIRESTPLLRTITGILFGGGTAWFMYPLIEDSIKETRFQLQRKLQVVNYLGGKKPKSI